MYLIKNKGITLIEILVIIAIIIIISSVVLFSLSKFQKGQALDNTTIEIVTLLNKARQNTLSSLNSTSYSVHFETDKMVLFIGSVYSSSSSTNETVYFDSSVIIPSTGGINVGGGDNVTFERLTGETIGGTIIIRLVSDSTKTKTITISKTGIISSN